MPQLMPLSWNFSIFMVLLILLMMTIMYSYKMESLKEVEENNLKKEKLNWWW